MNLRTFNRLTPEQQKKWLGNKQMILRMGKPTPKGKSRIFIYRYDPDRPLTDKEKTTRARFAQASFATKGTKGKTLYQGKQLPKSAARLAKKLKKKEAGRKIRKIQRIATLTADATIYENSVQLRYKRRGFSALFSGPPKESCPPVDKLKKGTKIRLTLQDGRVMRVELV